MTPLLFAGFQAVVAATTLASLWQWSRLGPGRVGRTASRVALLGLASCTGYVLGRALPFVFAVALPGWKREGLWLLVVLMVVGGWLLGAAHLLWFCWLARNLRRVRAGVDGGR